MLKYERSERIKWEDLYNHKFFDIHKKSLFKSVINLNKKEGMISNLKSFYTKQQHLSEFTL